MGTEGEKSEKKELKWAKGYKEMLYDNFVGYFDNTTVHGLKYLTERRRPWPEKVLWFFGVLVSLVACVWLMYKTSSRWVETPVIMAMDESQRAVWQIPFPAVTICPQVKINDLMNLTDFLNLYKEGKLSNDQIDLLAKVLTPCKIPIMFDHDRKFNDENATEEIEGYALKKEEVITIANVQSDDADFQPILTEEGLCYTFNMMPAESFFRGGTYHAVGNRYLEYDHRGVQWDPALGYEQDSGRDAYPRRALGAGKDAGLQLRLHTRTSLLHSVCNYMGQGFQILLHSPIEFPQLGQQSLYVPLDSVVQIAMTPQEIRTSQELRRSYTKEERQCYFPDERYLKYFKYYTQRNCELECLANHTYEGCGCVEFYMPRMPDTPVCGMSKKLCVKREAARMYELQTGMTSRRLFRPTPMRVGHPCGCMQGCTDIRYHSDRSQTELDLDSMNRVYEMITRNTTEGKEESKNRSIVFVYYKDSHYLPLRRLEVFGVSDFLASLGGLMGLCMGISLLSVIEFFYWLLIRPCCQRIKQSNPKLRSIRKMLTTRKKADVTVQYSKQKEGEAAKQ